MVNLGLLIVAGVFLVCIFTVILLVATPQKANPLLPIYNTINFPSGDQIIFYKQIQPIVAGAAQLSTNPSFPIHFLGLDSHGNVIATNQTNNQVINATANSPQANQILALANSSSTTNGGSYLTVTGQSYNPAISTITSPTQTQYCKEGDICHIAGKIIIADPATCHVQTVNGVQQNVCTNLMGPFTYTIQIICVDADPFRCSFLSSTGGTPTNRGETDTQGNFDFPWTVNSGKYYVGNYIARLYAESESKSSNGQQLTETGDYPVIVTP